MQEYSGSPTGTSTAAGQTLYHLSSTKEEISMESTSVRLLHGMSKTTSRPILPSKVVKVRQVLIFNTQLAEKTWRYKFWVNGLPLERHRRFCRFRLLLVAPQPYDLAKKSSINTNRKSTTRFPTSLR